MNQQNRWSDQTDTDVSHAMISDDDASPEVSADELRRAHAQLMRLPIQKIAGGVPRLVEQIDELAESAAPAIQRVGDLMRHPHPPLELLELTKGFAKYKYHQSKSIPKPVALTLYYLIIVIAQLRYDRKITSLSHDELRQGVASCMTEPWLNDEVRRVMEKGVHELDGIDELLGEDADDTDDAGPPLIDDAREML